MFSCAPTCSSAAPRNEFDKASNFLKNCGKPKDGYDVWLIKQAKETKDIFKGYVNAKSKG